MSPSADLIKPEPLEDELAAFRREWQEETKRRQVVPPPSSTSIPSTSTQPSSSKLPTSPKQKRRSLVDANDVTKDLEELNVEVSPKKERVERKEEKEKERPRSALELYDDAVRSEREGRLNDALLSYRSAFRLDPNIDRTWNRANTAAQARAAARGIEPPSSSSTEWQFERTLQLGPDYEAAKEHRSKEEAHEETGGKTDKGSTHPSSTSFLLNSLLKSIAENPFERKPRPLHTDNQDGESTNPPTNGQDESSRPTMTPDQALATLHFVPADEEKPVPLADLPHEVLLLILRHLVLSPVLPPPKNREASEENSAHPPRGKRALRKRTVKEEMMLLEDDLELEDVDREWKSDVEALERFARVCRAARVVTLDSALWRVLCSRTYVPPQQTPREESAATLVKSHGNDWRRFYVEHPRIRLDGCFISVVTYLRRGEVVSVYAPSHLITFYRYFRFYHHGLVLSLLTTDPPNTIVRRLNPSLRMSGLTFGRWQLRGDLVEIWGLEDPSVPVESRKYSFRMTCRLKSSARGRMNKLDMISMATERRETLEIENLPLRPNKPYFFSKVANYAHDLV